MFKGAVRGVRQGLDTGRRPLQVAALRSDRDSGQHHIHSDVDESRSLPGNLSSPRLTYGQPIQTQGDDYRVLVTCIRLCFATTRHLYAGTRA